MKSAMLIPVCLCVTAFCDDSFITTFEYGEMLYKNPRGIGCNSCHGELGEGKMLGKYTKNKSEVTIFASQIKDANIDKIKKSFARKHSSMPSYFLTDSEIEALMLYLKTINSKK